MVRSARPAPEQPPLEADEGTPPHGEGGGHRDGLLAGVLHIDLEVVLQVLAHTGEIRHDVDAEPFEVAGGTDAGELQELGGIEGAAAHDDLPAPHGTSRAMARAVLDPDGATAFEDEAADEGPRLHGEVRPAHNRVEVGTGGREAPAPVDGAIERRETFLAIAVHVGREGIARLLCSLEERREERVARRPALEHERPALAPVLVGPGEAGLHALEVGQAMGVVPVAHARIGGPALVVERVASLEDHPVDAAGASEHLAACVVDAPPAHVRLRLRLVLPVVEAAPDREGERRRHVDEDVEGVVGATRLQHENPVRAVGREPVGERAAGRTAAHDDEVVLPAGQEPLLVSRRADGTVSCRPRALWRSRRVRPRRTHESSKEMPACRSGLGRTEHDPT